MPAGTAVVDAFKNLIRHGKNKHPEEESSPVSPTSDRHSNRHEEDLSSRGLRQQQEQSTDHHHSTTQQQQLQQEEHPTQAAVPSEKRPKMPVYKGLEDYRLTEKMGDGAFSNVYRAVELSTSRNVAVKVVRKFELNASQRANILKEVQIMRATSHPSIVKLLSFSESPEHYFLVLELMEGGELFHQIVKLTYFSENLSRHVILQVASGIRYLHEERGVVHRDIKPENLLFSRIPIIPSKNPIQRPYDEDKEDEGEFIPGVGGGGIGRVKIADFGLSKVVWDEETKTPCGTVGYTAPEIVKDERYSKSVDMWALGCVLYTLLCGFPPFYDESINVLTEKVAKGYYTFLSPWWDDISHTAKDLITHLLCVDPAERYTIDEFFAHPWCNAAPAPPPPPTPFAYPHLPASNRPLDSPLLSAARGGRGYDGRSPGIATLKEAFDVTYAVHRMEEEGARRRKYNGRGGANRGFLTELNETEEEEGSHSEDEDDHSDQQMPPAQPSNIANEDLHGRAGVRDQGRGRIITAAGVGSGGKARAKRNHHRGFELDIQNATLLGRRHKQQHTSPLAHPPITSSPLTKMEAMHMDDKDPHAPPPDAGLIHS